MYQRTRYLISSPSKGGSWWQFCGPERQIHIWNTSVCCLKYKMLLLQNGSQLASKCLLGLLEEYIELWAQMQAGGYFKVIIDRSTLEVHALCLFTAFITTIVVACIYPLHLHMGSQEEMLNFLTWFCSIYALCQDKWDTQIFTSSTFLSHVPSHATSPHPLSLKLSSFSTQAPL